MIRIERPGQEPLEIQFILIDFEGTLAQDQRIHPKAKDKINLLSKRAKIYVLTKGDKEFLDEAFRKVDVEPFYSKEGETTQQKLDFLRQLGANKTVAIGNGADDAPMIEEAGFGICVAGKEGASGETIRKADLVVSNIIDALDFLLKPLRQKATLGL
jgi:soluble P-type ATPase